MNMNNGKYKKIISIVLIIVMSVCMIIALKNGWFVAKEDNKDNETDRKSSSVQENQKQTSVFDDGEVQIDVSQIFQAGEPVEVEFYYNGKSEPIERQQITVTDYSYSRKLDDGIKFKERLKEDFGQDNFDNDGTILKDYYYLYVDFTVKNIGKKSISYLPKKNCYIEVSKEGIAQYKYHSSDDYIYRPNTEDLFGNNGILYDFGVNDSISFELVYLVPENAVKKNDICIFPNDGQAGISSVTKKQNRFIALDLTGKER